MKFTIEMDGGELKSNILNGWLLKLTEVSDQKETVTKKAAEIIQKKEVDTEKPAEKLQKDEEIGANVENPNQDFMHIKNKGMSLKKAGLRTQFINLLAKYGANKLSEVKPEDYKKLMADLEDLK